jgi:hypothetical protein
VSPERGTNIPTEPEVLSRAHGVFDVRARAYVNPRSRVKFAPGLGVTLIVMAPFDFPETDPNYRWSRRPTAAVFGITPVVGMVASLTPFLGLYADLAPTIYLTQGAARAEGHDLFNGVTEPQLPLEAQQEPYAVVPLMGRLSVGVSVNF